MNKLKVTLGDTPVDLELASYKRMFEAACTALGEVSAALGIDPDEGGSAPILAEIAKLKMIAAPKAHASAEDYLRYKYGAYRSHFAWRELEEAYSQGRYDEEMLQGPSPYPDSTPPAPQGCLSNCEHCSYAHASPAHAGHCYMFFDEPQGVCRQWKNNREALKAQEPTCWADIDPVDGGVRGVLMFECSPLYITPLYATPPAPAVQPDIPVGYKLILVPKELEVEPDWDDILRQAEEATGLKVERHTLSIVIREVRRWIYTQQPPAPEVQSLMTCDGCKHYSTETGFAEQCAECCVFYVSKFEAKK